MGEATPTRITRIDVWKAADELLIEGSRPTIERIRAKIGRGSPNTVGPHLDAWFKALGSRIKDPRAFSAPPAVPDPIAQAANHFWQSALSIARQEVGAELATERARLDGERAKLAVQQREIEAERDRVNVQTEANAAALAALRAQVDLASERTADLIARLAALEASLQAERAEKSVLIRARDEVVAELDRQRNDAAARFEQSEERHVASEKRWLLELDRTREQLKRATATLESQHKEIASGQAKKQNEIAEIVAQSKERESRLEQALQAAREQLSSALEGLRRRDQEAELLQQVSAQLKLQPSREKSTVSRRTPAKTTKQPAS